MSHGVMKKLLVILMISPSILSAQTLYPTLQWAGISFITRDIDVSEQFKHSSILNEDLRPFITKKLSSLNNLSFVLNVENAESYRDGTISFLLATDTERISAGKLNVNNEIRCLSIYSISLQAFVYDQASQSILQIFPFSGEVNHLDPLIENDCKKRNHDLDTLRILMFYLSIDKSRVEQMELLKMPFEQRVSQLLNESNKKNSLQVPNNLFGEFMASIERLDPNAIRDTNFIVGISEISLSDLSVNQLSGFTEFSENKYFSDIFGFQEDAFKIWMSQQFTKWFNEAFNLPLIPFTKGKALGGDVPIKFSDSAKILNLKLPSLDFGFKINIRGFKKAKLDESRLRQAYAWGAFGNIVFENPGYQEYTSIDVKNILSEEVNKGDDIDDWKRFNFSLNKSMRDYIQNLKKLDKKWVKDNTNLKQKEFKKQSKLIIQKLKLKDA
jgi:hypothetical protein